MQVAWSLFTDAYDMLANNGPIVFTSLMVNMCLSWQQDLNAIVILVKGIYYVSMVGSSCKNCGKRITLAVNDNDRQNAKYLLNDTNRVQTKEQAVILNLNVTDKLRVLINKAGQKQTNWGYTGTVLN